jgi:hypothetical protein
LPRRQIAITSGIGDELDDLTIVSIAVITGKDSLARLDYLVELHADVAAVVSLTDFFFFCISHNRISDARGGVVKGLLAASGIRS